MLETSSDKHFKACLTALMDVGICGKMFCGFCLAAITQGPYFSAELLTFSWLYFPTHPRQCTENAFNKSTHIT